MSSNETSSTAASSTAETLPTVLKVSMPRIKAPNISAWDLLPRVESSSEPAWIPRAWNPPSLGPTVFETLCLDPAVRKEGSLADVHCRTLERHIACTRYSGPHGEISRSICDSTDTSYRRDVCARLIDLRMPMSHSDTVNAIAHFEKAFDTK